MGTNVSIGKDRITYVNGKPFFLIGARHIPVGGTVETLKGAGFNALRHLVFGHEMDEPKPPPSGLDGMFFWAYLFDRADLQKSQNYERALREKIAELKDNPALLCYENLNEPTLKHRDNQVKSKPENLACGTRLIRRLDPDHPIWLAHTCSNTVETLQQYNPCCDAVGANPYPVYVPGMRRHIGVRHDGRILDCPDQSVHAVGRYTEKMMKVAGEHRAVWMFVQALAYENFYNPKYTPEYADEGIDDSRVLYPTYEQMRFIAFDAVVHGATGLAFSLARTPADGDIWMDSARLAGELRELHDALCSPVVDFPVGVSYTDLGYTVWDGVRMLLRRKENTVYLFAVNTQFDPARITLHMKMLQDLKNVRAVHENRTVPVAGGSFRDDFPPYGVHVYEIQLQ